MELLDHEKAEAQKQNRIDRIAVYSSMIQKTTSSLLGTCAGELHGGVNKQN